MSLLVLTPSSQEVVMKDMVETPSSVATAAAAAASSSKKRRKSLTPPPSSRTRSKHRRCIGGGVAVGPTAGTPIVPMAEDDDDDDEHLDTEAKQKQQQQQQPPQQQQETATLTVQDIIHCIKTLFPDNDLAAVTQPCVSSRIFACFALHLEKCPTKDDNNNNNSNSVSTTTTTTAAACLQPLLPFLRSLVLSELVSLRTSNGCEDDTPRNCSNSDISSSNHQPDMAATTVETPASSRKIQFSGFDCSSTQPPVDRVDGSAGQHQDSIDALRHVVDMIQSLVSSSNNPSSQNQMALQSLIDFLDNCMTTTDNIINNNKDNRQKSESRLKMQQLCAMSIAPTYPHRRIAKAVAMYANEVKIILARIQQQRRCASAAAAGGGESQQLHEKLLVERRLAEFVGQAIRFQLRHLLNPAPPRLTPKDTGYAEWSKNYSQVHQLITLVDSNTGDYVSGERITSLFNLALDYLCEHFGLEKLLDISHQQPVVPHLFCAKPATNRGVAVRGNKNLAPLTLDEIADVVHDIAEATSFLAATCACRFLHRFLSLPRVRHEIERQGGWGEVETYASISWQYDLWKTCPEDEHLVMLCNYDAFYQKITTFLQHMTGPAQAAHDSLNAIASRFRCKTKSTNLKIRHPEIVTIAEHLEEAWQVVNALPTVDEAAAAATSCASDDDDSEEDYDDSDDDGP